MAPTFASAAASGGNSNSSRADGASDWTRRANGATQTFRRTSQATTSANSTSTRDTPQRNSSELSAPYIPPHMTANRNGAGSSDFRYSKDRFLELFRAEQDGGSLIESVEGLYMTGFHPSASNGVAAATWGRRDESKDNHSVDLCWDRNARMFPKALRDMDDEERELFNGTVNSPVKPPTLASQDKTPKDGGSHRKTSISQSLNSPGVGAFGLTSPTSTRPGNRRRETNESYPFPNTSLNSPSSSRFEEKTAANPPAALLRRRTEQKESISEDVEREKEKDENAPGGGLKRSVTTGLGVSSPSTWNASSSSAFSPMGSFGNFAMGSAAGSSSTTKTAGYGSMRGQSRFAGLMKDTSADQGKAMQEKTSLSNLQRQSEPEQEQSWTQQRQNRQYAEDYGSYDDDLPTGSAALGGGLDDSPPKQSGYGAFGAGRGQDDGGFSMLGMASDNLGHSDFSHQTPHHPRHGHHGLNEPMSPTNTNPYQSPENERTDPEDYSQESQDMSGSGLLPGLGNFGRPVQQSQGLPGLGTNFPGFAGRIPQAHDLAPSDRSQTSSTGPNRGFPSLSGLGGLPGLGGMSAQSPWAAQPGGLGTPIRDRAGFGAFGSDGAGTDMQSPVLTGLGGSGPFSAGGLGGGSMRSKLGGLFPSAMQEQMRMGESSHGGSEDNQFDPFARQHAGIGALSRGQQGLGGLASTAPIRHESPFSNPAQSMFDDLLDPTPRNEMPSAIGESGGMFSHLSAGTPSSVGPSQDALSLARKSQSNLQRQASIASPSTSQPPIQQMRTMVMPDRMRWIYKDPQGSTQGPWSGLEMHDWYRAGFFTPELLIKRVEDPEFEPLAQLIRRIGNSREPFLVPQIGVPHEPSGSGSKAQQGPAGVQPPFPNSFPSFGTTLTAEQQNALERRKQEEQFLMARQKEHLAQQQVYIKQQMGMPGGSHGLIGGQLHHHSSAHSLHSQPSFGSVTSPGAYQQSPAQGPLQGGPAVPGFFDGAFRQAQGGQDVLSSIRESDMPGMMERLNLQQGRQQFPLGQQQGQQGPLGQGLLDTTSDAQIAQMLADRANLQREQAEYDEQARRESTEPFQEEQDAITANERFQQFHDLQRQRVEEEEEEMRMQEQRQMALERVPQEKAPEETMTMTQQVQAASKAKEERASAEAAASAGKFNPWAAKHGNVQAESIEHPGQSASPMPAPVAQRKSNAVDNLVAEETRSGTASPAVETPTTSIAPWAQQTTEHPKTQSLREIQEAEAKRAAKAEAIAAAQRAELRERELAALAAAQAIPPAPGLPMGATWASQSPATSSGPASSAWATKAVPSKPSGKTLQQIQKEEEAKKQRALNAAQQAAAAGVAPTIGGKRYAELAGKSSPANSVAPTGSWTTVGAGGKVKAAPSPAAPVRSVSGVVPQAAKPSPVSRSTTMGVSQMQKLTKVDALGEFKKWSTAELQRGGLLPSINPSELFETLLAFGSEIEIMIEVVHSSARTIDSRHFVEEFIRRKKQADKGIVVETTASPSQTKQDDNAWSSVAKKSAGANANANAGGARSGSPSGTPATGEFKVAKSKRGRK